MTLPALALATGELHVIGRLAEASNLALLAEVATDGGPLRCIYKPVSGERPLWDFPGAALAAREVLTSEVARCFGWDLVPPTSWREEGPFGAGMCQAWVEAVDDDPVALFPSGRVPDGWCEVAEGRDASGSAIVLAHESSAQLQRMVVLDALVNNGDRKGGHVLRRADGSVAGIDHGVTFHAEDKLRTVLWGWAGRADPRGPAGRGRPGGRRASWTWSSSGGVTPRTGPPTSPPRRSGQPGTGCGSWSTRARSRCPGTQWPSLPWPPM